VPARSGRSLRLGDAEADDCAAEAAVPRLGGVTSLALAGDEVAVVVVWRGDAPNPVPPAVREAVRAVAPTTGLAVAGWGATARARLRPRAAAA
jgi:hypothetical protein